MRRTPSASSAPAALRSDCPIAGALDLIGDRWTLLVLRDLFQGRTRYGELLAAPEKIPTNLLADRLVRLARAGVVERRSYQDRPPRFAYHLTRAGRDLGPALVELARWGKRHVPGTKLSAMAKAVLAQRGQTAGRRAG